MKNARGSQNDLPKYRYHLKPLFYLFLPFLFLLQTISTNSFATEEITQSTSHYNFGTIEQGTFVTSAIEQYKEYFNFQLLLESLILPEEPNLLGKEKKDTNFNILQYFSGYFCINILQYFSAKQHLFIYTSEKPISQTSEVPLFVLHHAWKSFCI